MRRVIAWLNDHMPSWLQPLWRVLEVVDTIGGFYDKIPDPAKRVMWLSLSLGGTSAAGSLIKWAGWIQLNYSTVLVIAFMIGIVVWGMAIAWNPQLLVGQTEAGSLAARATAVARPELASVISDGIRWVTSGARYQWVNTLIVRPHCPSHNVPLYCEDRSTRRLEECSNGDVIHERLIRLFCSKNDGHRLTFGDDPVPYEDAKKRAQALLEAELIRMSKQG